MKITYKVLLSLLIGVASMSLSAVDIAQHPQLQKITQHLVSNNLYSAEEITAIFSQVEIQQSVLDAIQKPAEYRLTWGRYRNLFLQQDRIEAAIEFQNKYQTSLTAAEKKYGVPQEIILAIIGVESKYGVYKGKHKVIDSLTTLATQYPRRSKFFSKELQHFLTLCKQQNLPALEILGSYAGAMGYPQFIASSYQHYAVDFSGDGVADLINEPKDAIGSIANYLQENGWKRHQKVVSIAQYTLPESIKSLANRQRKLRYSAKELRKLGATIDEKTSNQSRLNVLMLNESTEIPPAKEKHHYIVRAGDTACAIARRFSVSCAQLIRLNELDHKATVYRDQKIILPKTANAKVHTAQQTQYKELPVYFYTYPNFYVITTYNQSVLYAMAVYDLAQAIKAQKNRF